MIPVWLLPWLVNRYTIGGLIALGLIVGAYLKGYSAASQRCHDAELRAQIASLQRDIDAAKAADKVLQQLQADMATQNADLQQQVHDYAIELAQRPPDSRCGLSPDDARRLRAIGGKTSAR